MTNDESKRPSRNEDEDDDDEPDEWDQRIIDTGCAEENMALLECHSEKKDWRQCIPEMEAFKKCWAKGKNNERTLTEDSKER